MMNVWISRLQSGLKAKITAIKNKKMVYLKAILFLLFVAFISLFLRVYRIDGKFSVELGNPKDALIIDKTVMVLRRHVPFFSSTDYAKKDQKIAWISDIHADRFKRRTVDSGTIYPRQYRDYLPRVFDELKAQGITTVIASGDNTNSGDDNYARELVKIAQQKRMKIVWVRGNHDNDEVMSILTNGKDKYYYMDYGNSRIVALDNVANNGGYQGSMDQEQLNWLREVLKTDKSVIIAMHIPIFDGNGALSSNQLLQSGNFANVGDALGIYTQLEKELHESNNVKMVLSGHWHVPWQKKYNGLNYYGQAALTRQGYSGAYAIIDLDNYLVKYLFTK